MIKNMGRIDEKIILLLGVPLAEKDGEMEFTEKQKELIHEIRILCDNIPMVRNTKEKAKAYAKDVTAEQIYVDMCCKIIDAPTQMHMESAARMLIPLIDMKLNMEI